MSDKLQDPPALEFVFEVSAEVADPLIVGELPNGGIIRFFRVL